MDERSDKPHIHDDTHESASGLAQNNCFQGETNRPQAALSLARGGRSVKSRDLPFIVASIGVITGGQRNWPHQGRGKYTGSTINAS
jgi:hypothetical protein